MSLAQVEFTVSTELIEHIKQPANYAYQSLVLNLYLDEEISFGKAAKLLNMSYDNFLAFLGQRKIPYFRETTAEIRTALQELKGI